ncbi:hypothetical protein [Achromobacter sp. DH1f]|uniref:hypothetical protein n=1 Tax=Achromobacter sp. DH1f TaxID=1397275 RepID=UPI000468016D|nr:hypothetical protein [Achromobacter sp. DH1f]
MDADDVAEKSRRNLMVVATGIVAVWALGIPLDGRLVGAVNLSEVEPWRAWGCTSLVLGYFWLRFHLAPDQAAPRAAFREEKNAELEESFNIYVDQQFKNLAERGSRTVNFQPVGPDTPGTIGRALVNLEWGSWFRSGQANYLTFDLEQDLIQWDRPTGMGKTSFKVAISAILGIWLKMHARRLRLRNLTWRGLELSLPYALALGAAAICAWKFALSLYNSFPFVRQLLSA